MNVSISTSIFALFSNYYCGYSFIPDFFLKLYDTVGMYGRLSSFLSVPIQPGIDMNPITVTTSDTSEVIIYVWPTVRSCVKTVL